MARQDPGYGSPGADGNPQHPRHAEARATAMERPPDPTRTITSTTDKNFFNAPPPTITDTIHTPPPPALIMVTNPTSDYLPPVCSTTTVPTSSSVTDFSALVVGVYKTSMPSLNSAEVTGSDLSIVYLAHQNEDDSSTMGVLRRYCLGSVLRLGNKITFTDVQVRGCCVFRPQHDFSPDSCELRLVNLNYTAASYAVVAGSLGLGSFRQLRTPRQENSWEPGEIPFLLWALKVYPRILSVCSTFKKKDLPFVSPVSVLFLILINTVLCGLLMPENEIPLKEQSSNFTTFMRACAEAHFERSFSRSLIFTPAAKPTALTASRTISASTPIQRRSGNHQAPSSATTTAAAVRSLSTLLRGDLASAASAVTPCKSKTLETPTSPVSVTPRPCRTRTGLSRPRSSRQTLSTTTYSAASALTTVTTAGSNCMRTRLRASQEAVDPIPPTVMSSSPAHNGPVEQTPVRRVAKQKEAPTSPSGQSSPSFLGSNFTATTAEALDDLNVSIADLVKTRRRSSSLLASPQSAGSPQCSSYPRTPRSRRKPSPRLTSPSVDAV
ncbi:unnamed protein product [Schistocephalus solidus]|uniref:Protein kinase domain-containing protein n=1 Tax=Schistocephalus solidus TaxID=70667 RepID=A0A183SJL7_SCHSO|nr:unnamed protein product [Schistocephalus solidus]